MVSLLEEYNNAREGMTREQRDIFANFFIGTLSGSDIPAKTWKRALEASADYVNLAAFMLRPPGKSTQL